MYYSEEYLALVERDEWKGLKVNWDQRLCVHAMRGRHLPSLPPYS